MNKVIEINKLSKRFGKANVLTDVSFSVEEGAIYAFLGPNGAGKTTTIKTLLNIIHPTSGTANIFGVDSKRLGPKEFAKIGYVSENQELPEWMSIEQMLAHCKPMYPTWDDTFAKSLLEQFELPPKKKLKTLSRGMKMKATLVSSLAYYPELLVFDEPFSGLDPLARDEFISGMLEISKGKSWTILISSHDMAEVERLADWVGVIDHGKLMLSEKLESLQQRFRQIKLSFDNAPAEKLTLPKKWLHAEQENRALKFIDSAYRQGDTEAKINSSLPPCSHINVRALTLREIFIVLVKEFKISNLWKSA